MGIEFERSNNQRGNAQCSAVMLSCMIIITVASISSQLSSIGTSIENHKLKETQLAASVILLFIYLVVAHRFQCRTTSAQGNTQLHSSNVAQQLSDQRNYRYNNRIHINRILTRRTNFQLLIYNCIASRFSEENSPKPRQRKIECSAKSLIKADEAPASS